MKAIDEYTFLFESSGRTFSTYGSRGLSLTDDGVVRYGYDGAVEFSDEDNIEKTTWLTADEKRELALFMIGQWAKFGDVSELQYAEAIRKLGRH